MLSGLRGASAADAGSTPVPTPLPPAPRELRIVSYNTYNFQPLSRPQIKSPESRDMVIAILANLSPDIAVLTEVGGQDGLNEIVDLLKKTGVAYPFSSLVQGEDLERNIAVISKIAPVRVQHDTASIYNLGGRATRVQRGFAHLVFKWDNGYTLHLLGAHLKSKMFDARGQTDMRRYEARLLRYAVNKILAADPKAHVLVVGDFNDTPDSSPVNTLCDRRAPIARQLFDLRPVDHNNLAWTQLQEEADTYSRIDYAMASYSLLPEIVYEKTLIPPIADWYIASDHRPLLITLVPEDKPMQADILNKFQRNSRLAEIPVSFFHDGPVVGTRKARKGTPAPKTAGGAVTGDSE